MLPKDFLQSDLYYQLKVFHLGIQLDGQFCFILFCLLGQRLLLVGTEKSFWLIECTLKCIEYLDA